MDSIWPLSVHTEREDPQDTGPKGGGFDEVGTGKSDKKTDEVSGDDRDAG